MFLSSPYSRRIAEKLGFELSEEIVWANYKVDGELLYPNTEIPTCAVLFKMLTG